MSGTSLAAVQAAEYAALTGSPAFMALVTGVFDSVPENQAEPFVVLGEATEVPFRTFGNGGHEVTRTHHIYDRDGAKFAGAAPRGSARSLAIMNAMIVALEAGVTAVEGHSVVDYAYEFGAPMPPEGDGQGGVYRHIPVRFRCVVEDAA